jgi:hypothetical protein
MQNKAESRMMSEEEERQMYERLAWENFMKLNGGVLPQHPMIQLPQGPQADTQGPQGPQWEETNVVKTEEFEEAKIKIELANGEIDSVRTLIRGSS